MTQELVIDINYLANNIETFVDGDKFYDVFDKDIIPQVFEIANLKTSVFSTLLTQGKSKYSAYELYKFSRKCNVFVDSFEDAIIILNIYKMIYKLKSSNALLSYFEKFNTLIKSDSTEITQLKSEIQDLNSKVAMMDKVINQYRNEISDLRNNIKQINAEKIKYQEANKQLNDKISFLNQTNNQLLQSINEFAAISQLRSISDFGTIYCFLKQLSVDENKLKMSISCAAGLSEKKDQNEYTVLNYACSIGDLQLAKSLIEGGCNRDAVNKFGNNSLTEASLHGHLHIVKYLIEIGFNKYWRNKINGFDAIICASQNGHLEIVKYLKSIGCDVNSKQNDDASCLYYASTTGHLDVVKYLISAGANPYQKDKNGFSPIIVAASNGHLDVVKYLIQIGCNKNDKTNYNNSPLDWASINGRYEVVEYLVSIRANLSDKDCGGKTALDYAKEKQNKNVNYKKIMNLLIRAGAK